PTELPRIGPLGLTPEQRDVLLAATAKPQGLILFTGPTGSGKTNSQYAAIGEGVDSDRNVITLEDPVEIELPGTTQVPIDEKSGVSFARGLRAALRQDPDVILVGEIRDQETAQLAVRAAITGHLVLSTLHTLDAAAAVNRLVDMGVPPYLVTSSLSLVASQRLVRVPCQDCSAADEPEPALLAELGLRPEDGAWVRAVGCHLCNDTGYLGRTAVMELLTVGPEVREVLLAGGDEDDVRHAARAAGTTSLFDRALALAREGRTTLAEVIRAVPQDPASRAGRSTGTEADL
ncbi:MAG TPA: ATPase, T2SS/T4P/T4SS family, partial [Candidatus Nanopelagicales bacterium]|nr:ATPase, T2SS/T4P/T4SS family [Candidatus Nanopelagicales bacterium]